MHAAQVTNNSVGWIKRGCWATSQPLARWEGITVDYLGRLTKIELTDNNLTGEKSYRFQPK